METSQQLLPYLENTPTTQIPVQELQARKTAYFVAIALENRDAMAMHDAQGNLIRTREEGGQTSREWGNVTEHCLVEAARASVLADLLNLPKDVKEDLVTAVVVHDFYKKPEITKLKDTGGSWESYVQTQEEADAILRQSGFSDRVISFATAVGHMTALRAEELAGKAVPSNEELAWLVAHYVDDYTIDDDWVAPASEENGKLVNSLDRRMGIVINRHAKPDGKYRGINLAGIKHFGEPTFNVQLRAGHTVEKRLINLLEERSGITLNSKRLPEFIDQQITERIVSPAV